MAIRNVYHDAKGLFFKGEGQKFYVAPDAGYREGDKLTVTSVSCGSAGAGAVYIDFQGSRRFVWVNY
jgi:hypothetical protein